MCWRFCLSGLGCVINNHNQGDSHCQGATVALLRGDGWRVVYKPRSLAIDVALGNFAAELTDEHGSGLYFRIPKIVEGAGYGWTEFVNHRYANGHEELVIFYRGIGNCLAVMSLGLFGVVGFSLQIAEIEVRLCQIIPIPAHECEVMGELLLNRLGALVPPTASCGLSS